MRISAGAVLLLPIALALGAELPLPRFDSAAALERFFFPADEEGIFDSMKIAFHLDNPGMLVTAAANAGPAYASKVAATIEFPEFRSQYAQLSKYLELFGPCVKKQKPEADGWWSGYVTYPGEPYCGEVTKLVFANTLWSQIHYCRQLAAGEVKPKFGPPPDHNPPYRLDETPVKTHWVNAEAIYALSDAAVALHFEQVVRKRAADVGREPAERDAMMEAVQELDRKSPSRELAGLALAKMMVRNYEAVHLRHLRKVHDEVPNPPPTRPL